MLLLTFPVIKLVIALIVIVSFQLPLSYLFLNVKSLGQLTELQLCLVHGSFITPLGNVELTDNPHCHKGNGVVEAPSMVCFAREFQEVIRKHSHHRIIGRCVITGDTQDLGKRKSLITIINLSTSH